ncbi:MAG: DUF5615 family PIN-like protein [Xanthomonadales bacterium]|nr:DUF5615 family PIN-like protein [Xanthomonadales bacterium]
MKLLLDQGVPASAVDGLGVSSLPLSAVHVSELGMSTATDAAIVKYARRNGLVIVTLDADFHALLALSHAKDPSVIRIREQGLNAAAFCKLMQVIWFDIAEAASAGALITVTETRIRIRRLPVSGVASTT